MFSVWVVSWKCNADKIQTTVLKSSQFSFMIEGLSWQSSESWKEREEGGGVTGRAWSVSDLGEHQKLLVQNFVEISDLSAKYY